MMAAIATLAQLAYYFTARQTKRAGFDSLFSLRRMNRLPLAVFHSQAMSPMGGIGGGTFGCAGTRKRQSVNPAICCPPSFDSDAGGLTAYGGHDMAATPINARSAHTFPQTEKAARGAARAWLRGAPTVSLGQWRDEACQRWCAGLPDEAGRIEVFNAEFSRELALAIALYGIAPASIEQGGDHE